MHPNSLLVTGEIAAVLAAIRSSSRWPTSGRFIEDSELHDAIIDSLKSLRRILLECSDWWEMVPLVYLEPFLHVIRSPETSGVVTDVALSSVLNMLEAGLLAPSSPGISEAMQALAEAVTQCKFEATYPSFDETVLRRILDVLTTAVCCPAGKYLSHDNLLNIFQASYRIGHYQTEKGRATSELLTQASRRSMRSLITAVFSRLHELPSKGIVDRGRVTPPVHGSILHVSPSSSVSADLSREGINPSDVDERASAPLEGGDESQAIGRQDEEPSAPIADATASMDQEAAKEEEQEVRGGTGNILDEATLDKDSESHAMNSLDNVESDDQRHGIVSVLSPTRTPGAGSGGGGGETQGDLSVSEVSASENRCGDGYGIDSLCEVLAFIIDFISASPSRQHGGDLAAHGLDLVSVVLRVAAKSLPQYGSLLYLLQHDLVKAMFSAARSANLSTLAGICQVTLGLYVHLGKFFLLQVEALLGLLLLPLAEGRGIAEKEVAAQIIALEGILNFCFQPGFARDMYLNLDCRIERSDLFQKICVLLSKVAFPVSGPVSVVHLLSLEGILAILSSLAEHIESHDFTTEGASLPMTAVDPKVAGSLATEDANAVDANKSVPSYFDIWTSLVRGESLKIPNVNSPAAAARAEKILKTKLSTAAEHFNHDANKGFQYARDVGLLPPSEDPVALARFLRFCPGLSKAGIGEVLGERDAYYEQVREAFMETLDFAGLEFETALRLFMDAFRPPGEGQKIDRLMQVFGRRYYNQMPDSGLKSEDAAYVLAFSVIMLNTDLHNTQNKKKMTLEDFARINRNTNEGDPMPPELLNRIYRAISTDELKISSECTSEELASQSVFWYQVARESRTERGNAILGIPSSSLDVERDMFLLIWGPTLAAVSIILESTDDPNVAQKAMKGLLLAAELASTHGLHDVPDRLIATLTNYTTALDPSLPRAMIAFGSSEKAQAAVETIFTVANRYGDGLRNGWAQVMDCMMRLYKAGLLSPQVIATDGESMEEAMARFPCPSLTKSKSSSGSLFSRAINSLISIDAADEGARLEEAKRDESFEAAARRTADLCHIEDLIADSKFLTSESLVEFVKSIMTSGGNLGIALRTGEGSDTAELALELLTTVSLRNRDRISLIWPLVHEYMAACMAPEVAEDVSPLVERAVMGLLRVCQRLLPYKEDIANILLESLSLAAGLAPQVIWSLAERIAAEVLVLIRSSGPYVNTESGWRSVTALIRHAAQRPEAAPAAFEALSIASRSPEILSGESYMPLLEVCLQLIDRYKVKNTPAAMKFLDCADALFTWLPQQGQHHKQDASTIGEYVSATNHANGMRLSDESLVDLWLTSVGVMARGLCHEEAREIRDTSIACLHRTLLASSTLGLPPELWIQTIQELLVPLVKDLAKIAGVQRGSKKYPGIEKSVRLAVNMLTKVMIQYTAEVALDRDFYAVWISVLDSLGECMNIRHESVLEAVPENAKNMLLVMASSGILVPGWNDADGRSLWDITWEKVERISPAFSPTMLTAAGIVQSLPEDVNDHANAATADGKPASLPVPPSSHHFENTPSSEDQTGDVVETDAAAGNEDTSYLRSSDARHDTAVEASSLSIASPDQGSGVHAESSHQQGSESSAVREERMVQINENGDREKEESIQTAAGGVQAIQEEEEEQQPPGCKQS